MALKERIHIQIVNKPRKQLLELWSPSTGQTIQVEYDELVVYWLIQDLQQIKPAQTEMFPKE